MPMMLFPFTSRPSFFTITLHVKRADVLTNSAAGLAWRPSEFTMGTVASFTTTAAPRPR